jgi:hypothetical protein
MTEQRKAVIKNADMSEEMQQDAVDIASQALAKYNIEKVRFLYFLVCANHICKSKARRTGHLDIEDNALILFPFLLHFRSNLYL